MSNLEKFIALYKECGVKIVAEKNDNGTSIITLEASAQGKIQGYSGFFTQLEFDKDGKFELQSIGE